MVRMLTKIGWVTALAGPLLAQSVAPAKAGLVSYAEEAYIDDRMVMPSQFFVVNDNSVLRTVAGRAEVLLGPCAAMWIDEKSSFRMLSSRLSDTSIELITGSLVVGAGKMADGTKLTLRLQTITASVDRKGLYRLDMLPSQIKVLAGRTSIEWENERISVGAGRLLRLDDPRGIHRFNSRKPDPLETWSNGRIALLAHLSKEQSKVEMAHTNINDTRADAGRSRLSGTHGQMITGGAPPPTTVQLGCGLEGW
jgi:hypothetical protein